jgi:hypothetical protein
MARNYPSRLKLAVRTIKILQVCPRVVQGVEERPLWPVDGERSPLVLASECACALPDELGYSTLFGTA